ncbi:hypothetical protein UFOVP75_165 [uncultured Caudovirales phage]|uniref:Uncharacterized protein n=1 Tax=uncultured Caudovirales phage TaxID=2100421 RepID=A0A6J5L185_9CAUD|nr:hypothetical protein UFOVP75_165 [uncultured Caudovirales phage]
MKDEYVENCDLIHGLHLIEDAMEPWSGDLCFDDLIQKVVDIINEHGTLKAQIAKLQEEQNAQPV